jgi:hypothetical protein
MSSCILLSFSGRDFIFNLFSFVTISVSCLILPYHFLLSTFNSLFHFSTLLLVFLIFLFLLLLIFSHAPCPFSFIFCCVGKFFVVIFISFTIILKFYIVLTLGRVQWPTPVISATWFNTSRDQKLTRPHLNQQLNMVACTCNPS